MERWRPGGLTYEPMNLTAPRATRRLFRTDAVLYRVLGDTRMAGPHLSCMLEEVLSGVPSLPSYLPPSLISRCPQPRLTIALLPRTLIQHLIQSIHHLPPFTPLIAYRFPAVSSLCGTTRTAGPHLSRMLEEVLSETAGFDELSLADNRLSDDCVSHVVEGLRHNLNGLQIRCAWVLS